MIKKIYVWLAPILAMEKLISLTRTKIAVFSAELVAALIVIKLGNVIAVLRLQISLTEISLSALNVL